VLSKQHALAVEVAGKGRALIRVGHLAALGWGARLITRPQDVSYHHILLPRHALMVAHGCPVESLFPGRQAMSAFYPDQRRSLVVVLRGLQPPVPGWSTAASYGARCLPLLTMAEARRWHDQRRMFPLTSGNRFFLADQIPQQDPLSEPAG
jgi:hypothetical protein